MNKRSEAVKELKKAGYVFWRNGSNHEIYRNETLHHSIPLKRHDFDENDLRYIIKEIKQKSKE